jgi:hypothetical protein
LPPGVLGFLPPPGFLGFLLPRSPSSTTVDSVDCWDGVVLNVSALLDPGSTQGQAPKTHRETNVLGCMTGPEHTLAPLESRRSLHLTSQLLGVWPALSREESLVRRVEAEGAVHKRAQ